MAEAVFHKFQLGNGAGTMAAPGVSQAAAVILPVTEPVVIELDRASAYPAEDYGRNARNHAGRGRHGVRGATFSLRAEATFQNVMEFLELHYAGNVSPTGIGPYTWPYPLEAGSPTLIPATGETATETAQDAYETIFLIDELTIGFSDLTSPGANPWEIEASCVGLDRVAAAITGALSAPAALESMMGHLSILKLGTTATAFASLAEISAVLVGASISTQRHLVLRAYGGASDAPTAFGFSEKTTGQITFRTKITSTTKTDILDAWEAAGSTLGEKRLRITVDGNGNNVAHFDARIGTIVVGTADRDGERVYDVTAELVDDTTLNAPCQWTIVNDIATLASRA